MKTQDYMAKTKAYIIRELNIAKSQARNYKRKCEILQGKLDATLEKPCVETVEMCAKFLKDQHYMVLDPFRNYSAEQHTQKLKTEVWCLAELMSKTIPYSTSRHNVPNLLTWLPSLLDHYEKQAKLNGFTPDTSLKMVRIALANIKG